MLYLRFLFGERRDIMGSTKCIASIGELSRKDNSLCFKNEKKHVYIPVENVKEIYCFNEVSINSKLLDFLAQKNIIVSLIIMVIIVALFIQEKNI